MTTLTEDEYYKISMDHQEHYDKLPDHLQETPKAAVTITPHPLELIRCFAPCGPEHCTCSLTAPRVALWNYYLGNEVLEKIVAKTGNK